MTDQPRWHHITERPLPENQLIIGISSVRDDGEGDWICIGMKDVRLANEHMSIMTTVGWDVHFIKWWHPTPELPVKFHDEWNNRGIWIDCKKCPAPQKYQDAFTFILFDEDEGIAEAEFWYGYQSDTVNCKHVFNKPLFWCPFPKLPVVMWDVLQI